MGEMLERITSHCTSSAPTPLGSVSSRLGSVSCEWSSRCSSATSWAALSIWTEEEGSP